MMLWIIMSAALASQRPDVSGDVVVERVVQSTPEQLVELFSDLSAVRELLPADCAADWTMGEPSKGLGGNARLTYNIGAMHRRLTMRVADVQGHMVKLDHDEKRGFTTQVSWKSVPGGTLVTFGSYLNPPPWPLKPLYFNKIQPAWEACYQQAVGKL